MSKQKDQVPQEKIALYDKLVASQPEIERKGKTMPYTSVNGHMFSILSKEGVLGLRLSKEDREAFVAKYNSPPYEQHGAVMKEYVTIPDELLQNIDELSSYLALSYAYTQTLKPKPSKKKA